MADDEFLYLILHTEYLCGLPTPLIIWCHSRLCSLISLSIFFFFFGVVELLVGTIMLIRDCLSVLASQVINLRFLKFIGLCVLIILSISNLCCEINMDKVDVKAGGEGKWWEIILSYTLNFGVDLLTPLIIWCLQFFI